MFHNISRKILWLTILIAFGTGAYRVVAPESFQDLEAAWLKWFRQPDALGELRGPASAVDAIRDLTALGSTLVLTLIAIVVCGWLLLTRRLESLAWFVVSALGCLGLMSGLKVLVQRPRPEVVPHLTEVSSWSWPSGHSMMSTVFFLLSCQLCELAGVSASGCRYLYGVSAILIGLVGLSRIGLGVHYPSDVLSGWLIGFWAVCLCAALRDRSCGPSDPLARGLQNPVRD